MKNMKNPWKITATLCAVVYLALTAYAAAQVPAMKTIAVMNPDRLSKETKALQAFQKELDKVSESLNKEGEKYRDFEKKLVEDLKKEQEKLSKEDFEKKYRDSQKQLADRQQTIANRKKGIDDKINEAKRIFREELGKHVTAYAKENKIDVILRSTDLTWYDEKYDITNEIIKRMDSSLPKIDVKF